MRGQTSPGLKDLTRTVTDAHVYAGPSGREALSRAALAPTSAQAQHQKMVANCQRTLMRKSHETLLSSCWPSVVSGCVTPSSRTSDSRDYAITTCEVSPQEIELVQKRARNYISRHPSATGGERYLAVEADYVFPSEVQDLWIKLGRSQTSSSAYVQRRGQSFKLWCVLIVDRSTQLPLTNHGYVLANTPARGAIVQIGGHRALYIGTGSSGF